jgi:hypothetical protein
MKHIMEMLAKMWADQKSTKKKGRLKEKPI